MKGFEADIVVAVPVLQDLYQRDKFSIICIVASGHPLCRDVWIAFDPVTST